MIHWVALKQFCILFDASCEDMLIHKGFDSNVENLQTRVFVKKVQLKSRANFEGKESAKQASSEKFVPVKVALAVIFNILK